MLANPQQLFIQFESAVIMGANDDHHPCLKSIAYEPALFKAAIKKMKELEFETNRETTMQTVSNVANTASVSVELNTVNRNTFHQP